MRTTLALLLCLAAAAPAFAHGGAPVGFGFFSDPSDANLQLLATNRGAFVTRDGGATWVNICLSAYGAAATEEPRFVLDEGTIIGAVFDGVAVSPSGCAFEFPEPELDRVVVIDVTRASDGRLFALQSSSGAPNDLYVREGDTWQSTGGPSESTLFERVAISPSDPDVIYLSGVRPRTVDTPRLAFIHRSEDGGASWTVFPFDLGEAGRTVYVEAVDPADPMTVFVRVENLLDFVADVDEPLLRSTDGGETFTEILRVPLLRDVHVTADAVYAVGEQLVGIAGASERPSGLWRSRDRGESFVHLAREASLGCVATVGETLYLCADEVSDGYGLARSTDDGETLEPVFRYRDMEGPVACAPDDPTPMACVSEDADLDRDLRVLDQQLTDPTTGTDDPSSGGCAAAPVGALWPLVLLALARRRR
ncbi:MAG: hypothetical protein AAF447_10500 [Myxococcota bacterium]